MADDAGAGSVPSTGASRESLEARVRELEAELDRKQRALERAERDADRDERRSGRRSEHRDNIDRSRDVTERSFDEANRLFRAFTMAHVEGLRAVADAMGTFADEVTRRRDRDDRDTVGRLPSDLYAGYINAVDEALKIPERTTERFQETYRRARNEDRDRRPEESL
jgi:hypothetical protein